jgi:hypothetical protein
VVVAVLFLAALLALAALVVVALAQTLEVMPLELELLELQTLAAVREALIVKDSHPLAQMAAQVSSSFLHLKRRHPPLDRLQSLQAVAGLSTPSRPLAASHSEVNDEHSKLARWRNQQDTPNSVWTVREQHGLGRLDASASRRLR